MGFKITQGKGFHITFENGWTVSVQFGRGSYCENYDGLPVRMGCSWEEELKLLGSKGSCDAECAVWPHGGAQVQYGDWGEVVGPNMSPAQVLELLNWAASQPGEST